jgi:hypothetical protein
MIKIIFSGGPTNHPPAAPSIFRTKSQRYVLRGVGTHDLWLHAKPPLPLHYTITCVHAKFFLLILYLAKYKLLFKALNAIK